MIEGELPGRALNRLARRVEAAHGSKVEISSFDFIDSSGERGVLFQPTNPRSTSVRASYVLGEFGIYIQELAEESEYGIGDEAAENWAFERVDAVARFGVVRRNVLGLLRETSVVVVGDEGLAGGPPGTIVHRWEPW